MILDDHNTKLQNYARKLCNSISEADDLLQDFYERVIKKWKKIKKDYDDKGVSVLFTIITNIKRDEWRRHKTLTKIIKDLKVICNKNADMYDFSPEVFYERYTSQLRNVLSASDLKIFNLYFIEGYTYKEIATQMEISISLVGVRIFRIRKKIGELDL